MSAPIARTERDSAPSPGNGLIFGGKTRSILWFTRKALRSIKDVDFALKRAERILEVSIHYGDLSGSK